MADPGVQAQRDRGVPGRSRPGPTPPDLEDMLRRGQDKLRSVMPGGNLGGKGFAIVAAGCGSALGLLGILPG